MLDCACNCDSLGDNEWDLFTRFTVLDGTLLLIWNCARACVYKRDELTCAALEASAQTAYDSYTAETP